ncbi:MAG: hypothetical protein EZS28_030986, partial [Streblomastix strix]
EISQCGIFEFEDDEELGLWSTYVLEVAAELKHVQLQSFIQSQFQNETFRSQKQPAKGIEQLNNMISAKHKRDGSVLLHCQSQNTLQMQFQQQRQQYSKFNSLQDQKMAQDLVSSFQKVLKKDVLKIEMLNYTLEPFEAQKLFDEISWEGANVIFRILEVGPVLPEEKAGYARRVLESIAAVIQGIAGLIHKVVQDDKDDLVGKMFKVFEASVVSVSDAQVENESRLEGIHQSPQIEDVPSQKTKEIFKRKSAKQHLIQTHSTSANTICTESISPNKHHFTVKQHNSTQKPISPKLGQQIEVVRWERDFFDPAKDDKKAVRWEHVSFDPEKEVQIAGCGDQVSTDLAVGYGDQGSTNLAINLNGQAECGDQGSTDFADQLEPNPQSLCSLEADQLTDQETISRICKHVASIHPIGDPIDHSQSDSCIIYHPGAEEEVQDTQIKSFLEEHQHSANIPIGGRLTHFVDAWKLIVVDALVTRGVKAFWINTQAPQILERNMSNPVKIRSKDRQLDPSKLIDKELHEDIIDEVPFSRLKWINPCFAILKSEPGKWRMIMDCSLLNKFFCATHLIMEDVSNLTLILQPKGWMIKIDLESAFHHIQVDKEL